MFDYVQVSHRVNDCGAMYTEVHEGRGPCTVYFCTTK